MIFYNNCSPLSQKANLMHLRLLTDLSFSLLIDLSFSSLSRPIQGCWPWHILVVLSQAYCPCCHLVQGGTKGMGRPWPQLVPSVSWGNWQLLGLVWRKRRRDILFLEHVEEEGIKATGGSSESKLMKAQLQHTEGNRQYIVEELAVEQDWTTLSVPAITVTFLHGFPRHIQDCFHYNVHVWSLHTVNSSEMKHTSKVTTDKLSTPKIYQLH